MFFYGHAIFNKSDGKCKYSNKINGYFLPDKLCFVVIYDERSFIYRIKAKHFL